MSKSKFVTVANPMPITASGKLEDTNLYKRAQARFSDFRFYHIYGTVANVNKQGQTVTSNQPVGTVCIGTIDGIHCRGISICSVRQQFSRYEGRHLALERMYNAGITQSRSEPIKDQYSRSEETREDDGAKSVERMCLAIESEFYFFHKSDYDVELTKKEVSILKLSEVKA